MSFKCIHIADVHFRGLKRHEEYKRVFESFFKKASKLNPDIIYIGGDIVHNKTQGISPELIDILSWWFTAMADICPVHVILGNHDGLILNEDRQDAITPIISALNNENIFLYKKSGTYPTGIDGYNWCVFSCFDEKNWDIVKPIDGEINIACYHGAVRGSLTDTDWNIEGEVNLSFFDGFDFGFLGDIHKRQFLDNEERIAYPGSTIQQNYGEDLEKGFLFWNIKSKLDYTSKFYKLTNAFPYITLDWAGSVEKTLEDASSIKKESRIRIKSDVEISQSEIRSLYNLLKETKKPDEIVLRVNPISKSVEIEDTNEKPTFNIYDDASRSEIVKSFINKKNITIEYSKLDDLFKNVLKDVPNNTLLNKNKKWSLNRLSFNNTFAYGKNNLINFRNMQGIVGIFGKNRAGKSSIPGTIMYTLFNGTDRGSLKNLHVINTRKGECSAIADITVDGKDYIVERKTIKKQPKKNPVYATTYLDLTNKSVDSNETEEQRRETEKILRDLIGTSEDFLYTSFASQGSINSFIKEKSTTRRYVLSKFLGLDIYEEMQKVVKDKYLVLKNQLKKLEKKYWSKLVLVEEENLNENESQITLLEKKISSKKEDLLNLKVVFESLKKNQKRSESGFTYNELLEKESRLKNKIQRLEKSIENNKNEILEKETKLEKINVFKNNFPISDLENDNKKLSLLDKKLKDLTSKRNVAKKEKEVTDRQLKILDQVPCSNEYPTCMFIKDAHKASGNKEVVYKEFEIIRADILEVKGIISRLNEENIQDKIDKYNDVLKKEYRLNLDIKNLQNQITRETESLEESQKDVSSITNLIQEMSKDEDNIDIENIEKIKSEIKFETKEIDLLEADYRNLIQKSILIKNKIVSILNEKEEYESIIEEWRLYDTFSSLVSKKGIPAMLINLALPMINKEISKILQDVTGFTVEIVDDEDKGNNLEIMLNYGDSIRPIECGSGMEKMMSSIAIRVALTNISNLPKSDLFIIDEGFGALDEGNVESCGRLLQSLKKFFRTILIISHVDAIKDIVDDQIEITTSGKDSHVRFE